MLRNTSRVAAALVTLVALFAASTATAEAGYGGNGHRGGGYQGGGHGGGYRQAGYQGGHRSHGYQGRRSYGHGHRSYGPGRRDYGHRGHGYQAPQYVAAQPCYEKVVIDYKIVREPYYDYVTVVDDYGCRHQVKKVFYREVEVPVKRIVKVCP